MRSPSEPPPDVPQRLSPRFDGPFKRSLIRRWPLGIWRRWSPRLESPRSLAGHRLLERGVWSRGGPAADERLVLPWPPHCSWEWGSPRPSRFPTRPPRGPVPSFLESPIPPRECCPRPPRTARPCPKWLGILPSPAVRKAWRYPKWRRPLQPITGKTGPSGPTPARRRSGRHHRPAQAARAARRGAPAAGAARAETGRARVARRGAPAAGAARAVPGQAAGPARPAVAAQAARMADIATRFIRNTRRLELEIGWNDHGQEWLMLRHLDLLAATSFFTASALGRRFAGQFF